MGTPEEPVETADAELRIVPGGWHCSVAAGVTLLEAAEVAGIALPSSCRNGTCRTCLAQVLQGRVAHRIPWPGLSAEEKAEGWVLPCVAHADAAHGPVVLCAPGAVRF
jgi:ferredoxin